MDTALVVHETAKTAVPSKACNVNNLPLIFLYHFLQSLCSLLLLHPSSSDQLKRKNDDKCQYVNISIDCHTVDSVELKNGT